MFVLYYYDSWVLRYSQERAVFILCKLQYHQKRSQRVTYFPLTSTGHVRVRGVVLTSWCPFLDPTVRYPRNCLPAFLQEGGASDGKEFVDEDNHTVLAGIRACRLAGTCEVAAGLLRSCEERWSQGPLAKDLERVEGEGYEWREMLVKTRESRRQASICFVPFFFLSLCARSVFCVDLEFSLKRLTGLIQYITVQ